MRSLIPVAIPKSNYNGGRRRRKEAPLGHGRWRCTVVGNPHGGHWFWPRCKLGLQLGMGLPDLAPGTGMVRVRVVLQQVLLGATATVLDPGPGLDLGTDMDLVVVVLVVVGYGSGSGSGNSGGDGYGGGNGGGGDDNRLPSASRGKTNHG
ncbi:hypothetical protein E2542_SST23062 [Spatholobus suberectus]|nr:hypothetical protein E2542_SST23062 [Spatholobus suberectus]